MTGKTRAEALTLLFAVLATIPAFAQAPPSGGQRWDITLEVSSWPALGDLRPDAGGTFKGAGFGIGGAWHFPVKQFARSELLLGVDGFVAGTDSDIRGLLDDVMARHLYVGGSVKWLFGEKRNVSLDFGGGYHEVDLAQVDANYWNSFEREHWTSRRAGAYVGATWDVGAGREERAGGLTLGLRAHFVDFGRVFDEEAFDRVLGADAGVLDGPVYLLRIGYSGR